MVTASFPAYSAKLDEGSGHAIGIGLGFFGLAAFFVILFLLIAWVGRMRDRRRGGPRPGPTLPVLGTPGDEHDPKTRHPGASG
ncbi:hypothetical protein [Allobranchiibius sp. CTAmp26]|uniref:hypothetical protein n=1 Tax=Allobranchiibius sp. CTAmp26 TaxID=2815214 RepID=UPI001AA16D92|nr:hypothetical protein [Allobranchiibius sp. CTAmp26]MBO1753715.1 hypothetical protein [Allobranchiibius sp. CTAmp26]